MIITKLTLGDCLGSKPYDDSRFVSLYPVENGPDLYEGFHSGRMILLNKPKGWTSFDVVNRIHQLTGAKTGHAGTLDPLATGLLICCTGAFTKKIRSYQSMVKEYTGTFILGSVTSTYDLESTPMITGNATEVSKEMIENALLGFQGTQFQVPPTHSAVKLRGIPVYKLARKGQEVKLAPRQIHIESFEITKIQMPELNFRVVCSTGTYIRSLASDFGKALGCGAYLGSLCRIRIGDYSLDQSMTMEQFKGLVKSSIIKD